MKNVIIRRRKELDITQRELAAMLGISDKTVSHWEKGLTYPSMKLIKKLTACLKITVDELFSEL